MTTLSKALLSSVLLGIMGCASSPTFQPEAGGKGALVGHHGGIVYSIPPDSPFLKMKLVSMGITKDKKLRLQMYFLRTGDPAGEYLDPREQKISLPDGTVLVPVKVHASSADKPMIKLAPRPKQAIEFLYQLPKAGGHEYPFINLNWKLHYKKDGSEKIMAQTERFDLTDKESPEKGVGEYDSYFGLPYAGYDSFPDVWMEPGYLWW